jgi:hypothetical protein
LTEKLARPFPKVKETRLKITTPSKTNFGKRYCAKPFLKMTVKQTKQETKKNFGFHTFFGRLFLGFFGNHLGV